MLRLNHRVASATIVESIVSLLVIVIVMAIALSIFVQASTADISLKRLKAQAAIETAMHQLKDKGIFYDEEQRFQDHKLRIEYSPASGYAQLVTISVFDEFERLVEKQSHVVLANKK